MSDKDISTRAVPEPAGINLKTIKTRIVNKHDTEAHWNASDVKDTFVPKQGEIVVYDIDSTHTSERIKIGDGTTAVGSLPFIGDVTAAGDNTFTGSNKFNKHITLIYGPEGCVDFGNNNKFYGYYWKQGSNNYHLSVPTITKNETMALKSDIPDTSSFVKNNNSDSFIVEDISGMKGTLAYNSLTMEYPQYSNYGKSSSTLNYLGLNNTLMSSDGKITLHNTTLAFANNGNTATVTIPNKTGTVALTSDIDVTAAGNNTFTGSNTFHKEEISTSGDKIISDITLDPSANKISVKKKSVAPDGLTIVSGTSIDTDSIVIDDPAGYTTSMTHTGFKADNTGVYTEYNIGSIIHNAAGPSYAKQTLGLPDKTGTLALTSDILEPHIVTPVYKYLHKVKLNKNNAYASSHINIVIYVTSESNTPVTDSASFIKLLGNKFKIYPGGTIEYAEEAVPISYITEKGVYYYAGTTLEKRPYSYFTSFTDTVLENDKWENSVIKVNENTTATEELQSITIGGIQYSIPSSGSSGDVTAAGDNVFTGYNSFKNGIYIKPGAGSPELNTFCGINKSGLLVYTSASGLTSTKTISVPMKEGTLALTNDIPDLLAHFPIGYIYISTSSTSPADLFGGTWEQIKDKFLLAAGDTYTAGNTGGSANAVVVRHGSHIRSASSIFVTEADYEVAPSSANSYYMDADKVSAFGDRRNFITEGNEVGFRTIYKGEDGTGKNMPPYLTVYMWERTA